MESILDKGKSMVLADCSVNMSVSQLAFSAMVCCSPYFVIPLRKPEGGYLTLVLQHQLPLVIFTTLEEFRK